MTLIQKLMTGATLLGMAAVSQAALLARDLTGDSVTDAYYDTELDITWLADWNYARTSGYDADGRMTWADAKAWAENLSFGGYTDWRLPTMVDTGGSGCNYSLAGGTDCGFNVQTKTGSTVYSEMAHLFHVTLGNLAAFDTSGNSRGGVSGTDWGLVNTGPFQNMQSFVYWSGLEYVSPTSGRAWGFNFYHGGQSHGSRNDEFYAVAVRPGDVAASVPEPQALALTLLALTALAVARRRRPR